jgi:hypothetical protein
MRVDERVGYFRWVEEKTAWPAERMEAAGEVLMVKMNQHEIGMGEFGFLGCSLKLVALLTG